MKVLLMFPPVSPAPPDLPPGTDTTDNDDEDWDCTRGDLLLRNLFDKQMDVIVDVRICNTDASSYQSVSPAKALERNEKEKKRKYLQPCLKQRRSFTPFVMSVDGMLGNEAKSLLKAIAMKLSKKWERPYSVVCGFIKSRLSFAIARATHLTIRGSRVISKKMSRPLIQDGSALLPREW